MHYQHLKGGKTSPIRIVADRSNSTVFDIKIANTKTLFSLFFAPFKLVNHTYGVVYVYTELK